MKIWVKLLLGMLIAIIFTIIFPEDPAGIFTSLSEVFIHIGSYIIFPLVLFSLIMATYELKLEKRLMRIYGKLFLYLITTAVILAFLGVISGLLIPGEPRFIGYDIEPVAIPAFTDIMTKIFPKNFFQVFAGKDFIIFLLPVIVIAVLLGLNYDYDKHYTRPVVQCTDGLSRIMYHINSFIVEIFWIGVIVITSAKLIQLKNIVGIEVYINLLLILSIDVIIVVFGVLPLLLYAFNNHKNPYKWLYASIAPVLTGLVTGQGLIAVGMLVKHGKESMHISRKIGGTVFPLAAVFSKAGTALVVSVSLVFLKKSIFGPEIAILELLWIFGLSIIISLFTSLLDTGFPGQGVWAALIIIGQDYPKMGQHLGLSDIAPLLISLAVVINVLTSSFVAYLVAQQEDFKEEIDMKACI
ncbi:MAG: dicarboxylate/amino acid:cation symporter [Spirochaetales bacterium]|nr:dicarboxylate/amino acid:cation symporter [Spirochaetales bacterium]